MKRDHSTLTLSTCFDVLRRIVPPTGVLMIGAGTGLGTWVQLFKEWEQANCTLVEGDENQFQHLAKSIPERLGWQLRNEIVGARDEATTFYRASNPAESGLLDPETLNNLWPNLRTTEACEIQSVDTLEELLTSSSSTTNWLLIDCLPAVDLLDGAANALDHVDLIAARALQESGGPHQAEAGLDALETLLQNQGFKRIAVEPERHPALCHAIYVRDAKNALDQQQALWAKEKACLTQSRDAQAKQTAEAKAALTVCRDNQAKLVAEHSRSLEVLTQAKAQLEQEKTALAGQHDEQAKLATERGQALEALNQAKAQLEKDKTALAGQHDEQAKLAAERGQALEAVKQAKAQLEKEKTALSGQLEEQAKLVVERVQTLEALKQAKAQLEQEKAALAGRLDEQATQAAERGQAIEALKQAQAQNEQEMSALATLHDKQTQLAAELQTKVVDLQQQALTTQASEADLSRRQRLMHEEMVIRLLRNARIGEQICQPSLAGVTEMSEVVSTTKGAKPFDSQQRQPDISIIMPVYNLEEILEQCLISIQMQEHQDFEVIIVNDGSIDKTSDIAKKFSATDPRFRLIELESNKGVSIARNVGIGESKGQFIRFVDGDDELPSWSNKALLENSVNQEMVRGSYTTVGIDKKEITDHATTKVISDFHPYSLPFSAKSKLLYGMFSTLFSSEFILNNKLRFPHNKTMAEDAQFMIDAFFLAKRCSIIPDVVYFYKKRMDSASEKSLVNAEFMLNIANKWMYLLSRAKHASQASFAKKSFELNMSGYLRNSIFSKLNQLSAADRIEVDSVFDMLISEYRTGGNNAVAQ